MTGQCQERRKASSLSAPCSAGKSTSRIGTATTPRGEFRLQGIQQAGKNKSLLSCSTLSVGHGPSTEVWEYATSAGISEVAKEDARQVHVKTRWQTGWVSEQPRWNRGFAGS